MSKTKKNRVGETHGRLTVLEETESKYDIRGRRRRYWLCQCECGNIVTVRDDGLNGGHTKSCGCLQKEIVSEIAKRPAAYKFRHGDSYERIHNIWYLMKYRCTNEKSPAYHNYGGRGIKLCDEWFDDITGYQAFKEWSYKNGYRDDLTIDRINNNGNYCPENCRWVDVKVQSNNKRSNHTLTYRDETHTIAQWAEISGIDKETLYNRAYLGWNDDRIFTQPKRKSPTYRSNHI